MKCDKDISKKENYIPTSFINRHNNSKQNLANEVYSRVVRQFNKNEVLKFATIMK